MNDCRPADELRSYCTGLGTSLMKGGYQKVMAELGYKKCVCSVRGCVCSNEQGESVQVGCPTVHLDSTGCLLRNQGADGYQTKFMCGDGNVMDSLEPVFTEWSHCPDPATSMWSN